MSDLPGSNENAPMITNAFYGKQHYLFAAGKYSPGFSGTCRLNFPSGKPHGYRTYNDGA